MLKRPYGFTNDKKIENYLDHYINDSIKFYLFEFIKEISIELKETNLYPDKLESLFPENFPLEIDIRMHILKSLYSLLMSKKKLVSTLIMEYVLSRVIELADYEYEWLSEATLDTKHSPYIYHLDKDYNIIGEEPDKDYQEIANIQESQDMTIQEKLDAAYLWAMKCEYPKIYKANTDKIAGFGFTEKTKKKIFKAFYDTYMYDMADDEDDMINQKNAKDYAEEKLSELWRIQDAWFEFCFWDDDYTFLDEMSVGEIRNSEFNKYAHLVPDDTDQDAYFLPDDWENSTDFHFLNRAY